MDSTPRTPVRPHARIAIVLLLAAASCAVASYDAAGRDDGQEEGDDVAEVSCGPEGATPPYETWRRYDDPFGRYSFSYPASWSRVEQPGDPDTAAGVFSYTDEQPSCVPAHIWTGGMAKIEVLLADRAGVAGPPGDHRATVGGEPARIETWRADGDPPAWFDERTVREFAASGLRLYAGAFVERSEMTWVIAVYSGNDPDQDEDLFHRVLDSWRWNRTA